MNDQQPVPDVTPASAITPEAPENQAMLTAERMVDTAIEAPEQPKQGPLTLKDDDLLKAVNADPNYTPQPEDYAAVQSPVARENLEKQVATSEAIDRLKDKIRQLQDGLGELETELSDLQAEFAEHTSEPSVPTTPTSEPPAQPQPAPEATVTTQPISKFAAPIAPAPASEVQPQPDLLRVVEPAPQQAA